MNFFVIFSFLQLFSKLFFTNGHSRTHPSSNFSGCLKPLDYTFPTPFSTPKTSPLFPTLLQIPSTPPHSSYMNLVQRNTILPPGKTSSFSHIRPKLKMCNSGRSCATRTDPDAGIGMKSSHSLCLMSSDDRSRCRILGQRAPSETLFAGSLVH